MLEKIIAILKKMRFDLSTEKDVQAQLEKKLTAEGITFIRECKLDKNNIPDFMIGGICIEIKIKGGARDIYRQLERYAEFKEVEIIILLTNRNVAIPALINNKKTHQINIGAAWL